MSFVIITPCRNEIKYIEFTLKSVSAQTIKPLLWIIVDDGSTDRTAEIIKRYSAQHSWIQYVCRPRESGQSYYGSNVYAIKAGYEQLKNINYDFLAILDADITLPGNYYETIIGRMEEDERLGIASGIYDNLVNEKLQPTLNDRRSTPKAIMVFRRRCFEEIDGFLPLKYGGEDTVACVTARMKGWKVWSYPDVKVLHHRLTGMGNTGIILNVRLTQGRAEWAIGNHWLFVLIKCMKRALKEKPYFVGGVCRWIGFLQGCLSNEKRIVSEEFLKFFRKEQMRRIIRLNRY